MIVVKTQLLSLVLNIYGGVNNVKMAALKVLVPRLHDVLISVLPQKRFRLNESFKKPDRYTVRNQMVQKFWVIFCLSFAISFRQYEVRVQERIPLFCRLLFNHYFCY